MLIEGVTNHWPGRLITKVNMQSALALAEIKRWHSTLAFAFVTLPPLDCYLFKYHSTSSPKPHNPLQWPTVKWSLEMRLLRVLQYWWKAFVFLLAAPRLWMGLRWKQHPASMAFWDHPGVARRLSFVASSVFSSLLQVLFECLASNLVRHLHWSPAQALATCLKKWPFTMTWLLTKRWRTLGHSVACLLKEWKSALLFF